MESNWWPSELVPHSVVAIVAASRAVDVAFVVRWTHIGITVTLAVFFWQQYEVGHKEKEAQAIRVAVLEERMSRFEAANIAQDMANHTMFDALTRRIDVHRTDIDAVRHEFVEHVTTDARRFERIGVK